jgi:hypothetical protein
MNGWFPAMSLEAEALTAWAPVGTKPTEVANNPRNAHDLLTRLRRMLTVFVSADLFSGEFD